MKGTRIDISGKSTNKDEFVTCGGVEWESINPKGVVTMESSSVPGLFFAGEFADVDGVTGGYNFQSAWTTGYVAGMSIAHLAAGNDTGGRE